MKIVLKAIDFWQGERRGNHTVPDLWNNLAKWKNFGLAGMMGIGNEPRTSQTRSLALWAGADGWVPRGWHEGKGMCSWRPTEAKLTKDSREGWDEIRQICYYPQVQQQELNSNWSRAGEAESEENPLWNFSRSVLVMAMNVSDLSALVIGRVGHAYWEGLLAQRWAHTPQINWWKSSKWASEPTGRFAINPQLLDSTSFKSSPLNQLDLFPPTT